MTIGDLAPLKALSDSLDNAHAKLVEHSTALFRLTQNHGKSLQDSAAGNTVGECVSRE